MYLLGISGLADVGAFLAENFPAQMAQAKVVQGMDAAAALIHNGEVFAAVSQERFDREKKSGAFPYDAIDYCLRTAGIDMRSVAQVCGNFNFGRYGAVFGGDPDGRRYWQQCLSPEAIREKLIFRYGNSVNFVPIDHHDAHLHAALASAPFSNALVIVMDAAGEIGSTTVYRVDAGQVTRLRRYGIPKSLGLFYSLITAFLGFAFNEDEYKIMGLSCLGNPDRYADFFNSAIRLLPDGEIAVPMLTLNTGFAESLFFSATSRAIEEGLGFDGRECSLEVRADVSAALQRRFTEALFHIAGHFQRQTGLPNFIMSGGCAENCAAIGELRKAKMVQNIHVAFGSGDEGTALGAAAAFAHQINQPLQIPYQLPFYGPAPTITEVRHLIELHGLRLQEFANEDAMLEAAAHDIAADKIVALCHGRMEYGARALGNRSLLALPANGDNKERINVAIKKRQNYRPFAPAVILEDASIYFDLEPGEAYPYMTMLTTVREQYRSVVPAITHFDGTARVQTVHRDDNPAFYKFLIALKRLTGVPVVLNTSYNVNHQPIVCSAAEAVNTFIEMEIDALYIANTKVSR
jgi:carbamoyltransferase